MSESAELSSEIAELSAIAGSSLVYDFSAGAALEELASVLIDLGLFGLDTTASLIHILGTFHTGNTRIDSRLRLISDGYDENPTVKGLNQDQLARIRNLFSAYVESVFVSTATHSSELADTYKALAPLLPPLTATSVIMHAHKQEDTRFQYYECPSLWAILLMLEDQDEKTTGLPPKELLSCFTQFCSHSRCIIAHIVIATFRFLLIYSEIPGIRIVLPCDPTRRTNRAVDVMKKKCILMYSYILHTIDGSQLKSASKNAESLMPNTLEEYIKGLIIQLKGRYNQLFSISMLKDQKPLRPVRPFRKDNRGGTRFHKKAPKHDDH